ncbi:MAG: CBS domain-containing protein [Gammaproteobacteria bacterium]|nr:CBS domain-containing protein [Gammaproteobacteria bacterium]
MTTEPPSRRSWLKRLVRHLAPRLRSRQELADVLEAAHDDKLLDSQSLEIIRGAFLVSGLQAREIMVPSSQMVVIEAGMCLEEILQRVIQAKHSRYPVVGESLDDIRGVLLAKDLLPLMLAGRDTFRLADIVRPATMVPETKRLDILLREFREERYHMAMVVDEYGGVSGVITIEDILEEIVGDIADEKDRDPDCAICRESDGSFLVAGLTAIEDFNDHFRATLSDDEFDTIGGLVTSAFGHLPEVGECITLDGLVFTVVAGGERQVHQLRVTPVTGC